MSKPPIFTKTTEENIQSVLKSLSRKAGRIRSNCERNQVDASKFYISIYCEGNLVVGWAGVFIGLNVLFWQGVSVSPGNILHSTAVFSVIIQ